MGILLCCAALGSKAEEQPPATRVEHFFVASDGAQALFTSFKDTFQLPEVWPFKEYGNFSSGGLSLGNVVLEFALLPSRNNEPRKTQFQGIALEPKEDAEAIRLELTKRSIPFAGPRASGPQAPGRHVRVGWENVSLVDFPPDNAMVFFCDYKDREGVARGRRAASDELAKRSGGSLGIVGAAEITVGVRDLEEARSKWSALLAPSPRISDDTVVFESGPRIRLVRAESPGIQGIVLSVRSLGEAEKFLKEHGLLARDDAGHVTISPAAIDGLSIQLVSVTETRIPIHPLLGTGRGVDHVGIGVRDLEKAVRDYEEILGFRCTEKDLPSMGNRALLRRLIFFEDDSLIEFLSPSPDDPATGEEFREWVKKHEGGTSLALRISSAQDAAAYLEAHNFEVKVTGWPRATAGEANPAQVQYYSVTTPDAPSGNRQVFMTWIWLVEYVSSPERAAKRAARREQGLMVHPNTARSLHSAWFAVRDVEAGLRNLHDAGFEAGGPREAKFLGAAGREVKAGLGSVVLLRAVDEYGPLSKFLSNHDDGEIIAISIEFADLNKARSWVEDHSGRKLEPYDGFYGRSVMIPPDMTHGVWLEMFQR